MKLGQRGSPTVSDTNDTIDTNHHYIICNNLHKGCYEFVVGKQPTAWDGWCQKTS
jgi:hypothetical protein